MLSAIGRAAIRRTVARGNGSTKRAFQLGWQLYRAERTQNSTSPLSKSPFDFSASRSYATTIKTATEPKSKAKSATPKAKTAVKRVVKKKPSPKKKVVKKAIAKPKAKRAKKELSPELQKAEAVRAEKRRLKKIALKAPGQKAATAWTIFLGEQIVQKAPEARLGPVSKTASKLFKELKPEQLQHYNHVASENRAANEAAYKAWVNSHTPAEINAANNARALMRRKNYANLHKISDPRLPKRPILPSSFYLSDRFHSEDFKGMTVRQILPLVAKEFHALPPSERQVYIDRAQADRERYHREHKTVYHRDAPSAL